MNNFIQTVQNRDLSKTVINKKNGSKLIKYICKKWTKYIQAGELEILWPDGTKWLNKGDVSGLNARIVINNPRFVRRCIFGGAIGFADSYIDGDWETPDLTKVISLGIANEEAFLSPWNKYQPSLLLNKFKHSLNANTYSGSQRNIASHYDLGNEFYQAWLDNSMTYSSGIFNNVNTSLDEAQNEKYKQIAEITGLNSGDNILEIGCGWGGFAIYAAKNFGCRVTALTLSKRQAEWAKFCVSKEKLSEYIEIRIQDYRDTEETYDRIVSIEMFEAVGEAYWDKYFTNIRKNLVPGGTAGLQVITIDNSRLDKYRSKPDFIQLRVFPGGMLPSDEAIKQATANSGLNITFKNSFSSSYALTLKEWRKRFLEAWPYIEQEGFDEKFRRLWTYYLSYCEAGFLSGTISVGQYRLEKH